MKTDHKRIFQIVFIKRYFRKRCNDGNRRFALEVRLLLHEVLEDFVLHGFRSVTIGLGKIENKFHSFAVNDTEITVPFIAGFSGFTDLVLLDRFLSDRQVVDLVPFADEQEISRLSFLGLLEKLLGI